MAPVTLEQMQADQRVMGIARVVALANAAARAEGTDPADSLITLGEEPSEGERVWRVSYVSRDYRNQRGGDLIVFVDEAAGSVRRIVYGQ
jgi:hypothetical protein